MCSTASAGIAYECSLNKVLNLSWSVNTLATMSIALLQSTIVYSDALAWALGLPNRVVFMDSLFNYYIHAHTLGGMDPLKFLL